MTEVRTRDREFAGTERFEVRRRLGYGGFGIVYEAYDRERDMITALKTLRRMSPTSLYRFKREFRALADVADPNLVTLYELLNDGDEWFFTMELIDGVSFLDYLGVRPAPTAMRGPSPAYPSTRGMTTAAPASLTGPLDAGVAETVMDDGTDAVAGRPPPPAPPVPHAEPCRDYAKLRRATIQLARGLSALHRAGKLHRDIKPTNVLVEPGGRVVLLDFGLVAERGSEGVRVGRPFEGTPAYASPEQAVGAPVSTATDWFSVGVMLYEALTGALPHAGNDLEILLKKQHTDAPPPAQVDADVPADLSNLCAALLERDPEARPDGDEVLARLGDSGRTSTDSGRTEAVSAASALFVGRQEELAQLDWAFDDAAAGSPVVAVVSGASGIGKSALVLEHLRRLRERASPPVMLLGRCFERESVPYKAFDGVVDALTRHLLRGDPDEMAALLPADVAPLARLFPVLRRLPHIDRAASESERVTDPDRLRQRAFTALRELLGGLANRGTPLVLAIDDFQWADADSRALLREVMRPGVAPPVLLVTTLRTPPAAESIFHTFDRDARALGLVRHIPVEPLSTVDAVSLAQTLIAGDAEAVSADSIARESSGHPLFIHELVRHRSAAAPGDAGAVDLDRALGERVSRLDPRARRLLEVVVLAGSPLAQQTVARAADMDYSTFSRLLAGLQVGNLARTSQRSDRAVEPFHDRIRKAVMRQLDDDARRRHHAALAAALLEDGTGDANPHVLVQHLHASGESRRASAYAHRAAERAARAFAFDQAAELFRRALELGAFDPEDGRALRMQLAESLVNAGRGPEAADEYLAAAVDAAPRVRMRCRRIAAEQLLTSGHIERGMGVLDELLRQIDRPLPTSSVRAAVHLVRERAALRARGLGFVERPRDTVDAHELERIEVLRSVAFGLGVVDNVRAALYQTRAVLGALQLGEPRLVGECVGAEAVFLGCQSVRARRRARKVHVVKTRDLGERYDDPLCRAWTAGADSSLDFFNGDLVRGIDTLVEAEALFRDHTTGNAWPIDSVRHFRAMCLRILGRFRDVRAATDEMIDEAQRRGNRYVASSLRRGRTIIWLGEDDPERVRAELAEATWTPWHKGFHVQHFLALEAQCELALYEGAGGDAYARYAPQFRAHALSMGTRVQMIRCLDACARGRLLLARASGPGRKRGDLARVRWIAGRFDREGVSYARVFAALLRAGVAAVEGHDAACVAALRRGIREADAAGMEFHAAAARLRLAARVRGGERESLRAGASAWVEREEVRNPDRLIAVAVPGF